MKQTMNIKIKKTWQDAYMKYDWEDRTEGLCIDYSLLQIAEMAQKDLLFVIQKRSRKYQINPEYAQYVVKKHQSVFTRKSDRKPVAVIPLSKCQVVY